MLEIPSLVRNRQADRKRIGKGDKTALNQRNCGSPNAILRKAQIKTELKKEKRAKEKNKKKYTDIYLQKKTKRKLNQYNS